MKNYSIPVIVEKDFDGYVASCPPLQGCVTQGATYEEVMCNIEDAIRLHIEDRQVQNETIASAENVSISLVHCAVE